MWQEDGVPIGESSTYLARLPRWFLFVRKRSRTGVSIKEKIRKKRSTSVITSSYCESREAVPHPSQLRTNCSHRVQFHDVQCSLYVRQRVRTAQALSLPSRSKIVHSLTLHFADVLKGREQKKIG
jgi:hypothetical protein